MAWVCDVLGSDLGQGTDYPENLRYFSQAFHEKCQNGTPIMKQPFPSLIQQALQQSSLYRTRFRHQLATNYTNKESCATVRFRLREFAVNIPNREEFLRSPPAPWWSLTRIILPP